MKLTFVLSLLASAAVLAAGSASAADLPPLPEQQGPQGGGKAEAAQPPRDPASTGAASSSSAPGPGAPASPAPASTAPAVRAAPSAGVTPRVTASGLEARDEPAANASFTSDPNKMWLVTGSVRETFVGSRGFDPYSQNDVLPQWTFAGSRTLLSRGRLSFAAGASWDVGGASTTSRGLDAGVFANRFAATAEGRWHPRTYAFGFVRLSPGANVVNARVNDPSAPGTLTTTQWSFSGDASVGAAITPMVAPGGPRVWLVPEVGYSYATSTQMKLAPKNEKDITGAASKTDLGELALSGVFFRVGLALSF